MIRHQPVGPRVHTTGSAVFGQPIGIRLVIGGRTKGGVPVVPLDYEIEMIEHLRSQDTWTAHHEGEASPRIRQESGYQSPTLNL